MSKKHIISLLSVSDDPALETDKEYPSVEYAEQDIRVNSGKSLAEIMRDLADDLVNMEIGDSPAQERMRTALFILEDITYYIHLTAKDMSI